MRKIVAFAAGIVGLVIAGAVAAQPRLARADAEAMIAAGRRFDVRILRDEWGVPHVFGKTDADVAYGLAYAHAEDDFATIQGALIAARGELAAVYGRKAAPNDYMVHLLRIWDVVDEAYGTQLSPEARAICEAYAAGLSHYAATHPKGVRVEFLPYTGKDVVAGFVHKIPLFFGMDKTLGELFESGRRKAVSAKPAASAFFGMDWTRLPIGSNTFSVAPARSADGKTRLAVNSHQPYDGPVAWYEAHLHSEEGWDAVGGVFPGAPVILHGHNRRLGWAHTVNGPDLIDVYVLDINPENPNQYRFDGEWRDLEVRTAPIRVKLLGPIKWTFKREVLWSVYGPVVRRPHGTYAIRYAGMGEVRQIEQWYRMNKATAFDEWLAAMRLMALPMFNTGYADEAGNIYYLYNGNLPVRAEGYDWKAYLPGDTSDTLWTEYLPFERLPQVRNPKAGYVINCNSSPFRATADPDNPREADYSPTLGIETRMTNRALRAQELFGADASITGEEFDAYKFDLAYSAESEVAALVEQILAAPESDDPVLREAREALRAWDLRTNRENTSTAIGVLSIRPVLMAEFNGAEPPALSESFAEAARALRKAHGRVAVPWGEVNRLRRGDVDVPLDGGPDILRAVYGGELENGRSYGRAGDCYVLLVEWGPDGVRSRSIHQYGTATLDASSPHYADQAPLFARLELKPVWMTEAEIREHLEREYRPGEERD